MRRLAAVLVAVAFPACGWNSAEGTTRELDPDSVLSSAAESLAERRSGQVEFSLRASAEGTEEVGFDVHGDYSFAGRGDLALVDLTYAVVIPGDRRQTRVLSDGTDAWAIAGGEVHEISGDARSALRVSDGASPGLPHLDIEAWIEDPKVVSSSRGATVTGDLDVVAFLADLQRLSAEVGGQGGLDPIDESSAERLVKAVDQAAVTVRTIGADHRLRSLRAAVDFGASVPERLREALGQYAGARLELGLELRDLEAPLRIERPDGAE